MRLVSISWNVAAEVLEQRTLLAAPTLDWGVSFGTTTGTSTINSTAVDTSGNIYVAGVVTHGTVDVDPGAGTTNVTADNQTGFVAKYTSSGSFLWVETFSSDTTIGSFSLTVDAAGGVYVAGGFRGTATFGVGETHASTLVNEGGHDANGFVAKLDQSTGDLAWVDGVLGDLALATTNVAIDASGRVFIAGQAGSGTITIKNGETGTVLDTFSTTASNYVARLDSAGAVVWAEGFAEGKASIVAGSGLAADSAGNVYLTGALLGKDVDFNPGAGEFNLSRTARISNTFVAKLDVNGNFVWATKDDATGWKGTSGSSIAVDAGGNSYVTMQQTGGGWGGGWGGWNCGPRSGGEQQLARLDSSGNWQWTKTLTPTPPVWEKYDIPTPPPDWDCTPPSPPPECNPPPPCENDNPPNHHGNWSHGSSQSPPVWTPPASSWQQGSSSGHNVSRSRRVNVSSSTAKVALDNTGNAVVVSASSGAAAYSSTGAIVWSTTTPMPVTDVAVDSSGNIVFVGAFSGEMNVSPDGTYLLDANTWWRKSAPFLVRWKTN